jgi:GEVED domain/Lectin C-type domain/Secretion system C-terminal sorting domain/PGAP1-like protein/HYR domain
MNKAIFTILIFVFFFLQANSQSQITLFPANIVGFKMSKDGSKLLAFPTTSNSCLVNSNYKITSIDGSTIKDFSASGLSGSLRVSNNHWNYSPDYEDFILVRPCNTLNPQDHAYMGYKGQRIPKLTKIYPPSTTPSDIGIEGFITTPNQYSANLTDITPDNKSIIGYYRVSPARDTINEVGFYSDSDPIIIDLTPNVKYANSNTKGCYPSAISANGRFVAGSCGVSVLGSGGALSSGFETFVWDKTTKITKAKRTQTTPFSWNNTTVLGISNDGNTIILSNGNEILTPNRYYLKCLDYLIDKGLTKVLNVSDTINIDTFKNNVSSIQIYGHTPNMDTLSGNLTYKRKSYWFRFIDRGPCLVDLDRDGICADIDCNDNNANIKTEDKDKDGVCSDEDCNDNDPLIKRKGDLCDDRDPNTINDKIDANCRCVGTSVNKPSIKHYVTRLNKPEFLLSSNELGAAVAAQTPFKVCADGSDVSVFSISVKDAQNYKLVIREDPSVSDTIKYGKLFERRVINSDSIVYKYRHPNIVPQSVTIPFQIFKLDVLKLDSGRDALVDAIPLYIYRPPVLMVHGLWAGGNGFIDMEKKLIEATYLPFQLKRADYESRSAFRFALNDRVVPDGIDTLMEKSNNEKIAVGRVDVVVHSMGGLLSRQYIQGNRYRNDIHKLITCNTPHSGSQAANYLFDNNIAASAALCDILGLAGNSCSLGAVSDLRVNSDAISLLNSPNSIIKQNVPSHAIVTITTTSEFNSGKQSSSILKKTTKFFRDPVDELIASLGTSYLFTQIFKDENDLVVAKGSQLGGLPPNQSTLIRPQVHMGSVANIQVIDNVIKLLNLDSKDSKFSQNGFSPPTLIYTSPRLPSAPPTQRLALNSSSITVISPQRGKIYKIGDTVEFNIQGVGNIESVTGYLDYVKPDFYASTINSTSGKFTFIVDTIEGKRDFLAFAFDTTSASFIFDTIHIIIQKKPNYNCPTLNKNIGDACDDGNPLTTNDKITADCTCKGKPIVKDCPTLNKNIGDVCDDGDASTTDDKITANCACKGIPKPKDCPILNKNIGDVCDDGNSLTINDKVQADCSCKGTIKPKDCPTLNKNIGDVCDDDNPLTIDDKVQADCSCKGTIKPKDCPTLNKNIGDVCDDGNPLTIDDKVQADCSCKGTIKPKDCPTSSKNIGDICDDNNANTENDKIQSDCTCKGTTIVSNALTITCPTNIELTIPQGATYTNVNWNTPTVSSNCTTNGGVGCTATSINGFTLLGEREGHQYYISNQIVNWREAKQLCISNGGYLAAITSQTETDFLKSKLRDMVFIGLNDENTEGVFQWTNGESSTYSNWALGQPAQSPQALTEDYVVFQNWDGKWDDVNGFVAKKVLLEINCGSNSTTIPPTIRQTAGITNGNAFPVGVSTVNYEAKDACNNVKTCSFTITIKQATTTSGNSDYCASNGNTPWEAWIAKVNFKQINQQSNKEAYGNFKGTTANVTSNEIVPISITPNFSYTQYDGFVRVWIDYNGDKDFEDAGEMVVDKMYKGGLAGKAIVPITENITIPTTAKLGTTCMRICFRQNIAPKPCDVWSNAFGEVEDYSISIGSNVQALVMMGSLKVELIDNKARLDWVRRSNNIVYFEVEKSINGSDFVFLEKIYSNPKDAYHYIFDKKLIEGDNYYRLKIVQSDGSIEYSPIRQLFYEKMLDFIVFPNPANDEVWIDLKAFENRAIEIIMTDVAGKEMLYEKIKEASVLPHRLDLSGIESGSYFITIQTKGKRTIVRKLWIMK